MRIRASALLSVTAGTLGMSPAAAATVLPAAGASSAAVALSAPGSAILGGRLRVSGRLTAPAGAVVELQRLGRETGWTWAPTAQARVRADGSFVAVWHVNHIGRFQLRAILGSGDAWPAAGAAPTLTVIAYRPSVATIYGPGFYGRRTACGQRLGPRTLGVAHRTLPCGTPVAIYYQGRRLTVPVIDRGPYASGVDWDLTEATAAQLGVTDTATIDAVSLPTH